QNAASGRRANLAGRKNIHKKDQSVDDQHHQSRRDGRADEIEHGACPELRGRAGGRLTRIATLSKSIGKRCSRSSFAATLHRHPRRTQRCPTHPSTSETHAIKFSKAPDGCSTGTAIPASPSRRS